MKTNEILAMTAFFVGLGFAGQAISAENNTMTVYKNPSCGCCGSWANAMEEAGYKVKIVNLEDLSAIKKQASVTDELAGCHTAFFGKYVLEGHVPLQAIEKLMSEKPDIRGLATPGMPMGSLGMGYDKNAKYTVYAFGFDTKQQPTAFYQAGE